LVEFAPRPPPVDVKEPKTELLPLVPVPELVLAVPPAPTVITEVDPGFTFEVPV
jgi:hypothetical protein